MGAGVLRPSACQTGVLGPQSLALGLGPSQAQYLGLNPCLHHLRCLVVLERQPHLQQCMEQNPF